MTKFADINTKIDIELFVESVVGENKECEKNLLMTVALFLKYYCPVSDHDCQHMISLLLANTVSAGARHPRSNFDCLIEQIERIDTQSPCLVYYDAYKTYPVGVANQAIGNLVYKLSKSCPELPKRSVGNLESNVSIPNSSIET